MIRQTKRFNGTVEFNTDREDYTGDLSMTEGWVQIENEYIPRESIRQITVNNTNTSESM